ncbi:LysR family transcriptional regulator [Anaerovorax odorimutans]|uniref:LysR family transcriptional regulator n=1 Tax=Anaerovorax odorimutans TaxID=109327 RepID=A0ABT1RNS5_9FIRM|nr:LysR family transcriptional regulator [Anaerovorax odorimutans]MCQ4636825.1 LysR family transcriptional regulator [Anaerovorax odorimutans]
MMNINHLRYFEEVCRQGSITKASEACHISQPSITAAINGLESELGYKLFSRVSNRLRLTSEGEAFQQLTDQFLKEFATYYEKACDLAEGRKVILRLGVPAVMGTFFFKRIIPDFSEKHPNIELEIFEIATIDGIRMLANAELDLLLGIKNESCYTNCDSKEIFATELQLAVSKNHPLGKKKKITAEMLAELPLVIISKGSYHYKSILTTFSDIDLNIIMHSSQLSTIRYMIRDNDSATIIYKDIFADDPDIRCIPLERPMPAHVHVFWQKNTYLSSAMRSFISYITQLEF